MADGDGDLLVGDKVFHLQLGALVDDLGAAGIAILVADFFQFLDDDGAQFLLAAEDLFVLGDLLADLGELVEDFVDGELGEAVELQLEDGIDLAEGKALFLVGELHAAEVDDDVFALAPGVEVLTGLDARTRSADDADDGVKVVDGDFVAFKLVFALARLAQQDRRCGAGRRRRDGR